MHLKALKVFCDVVTRRSFSRGAADNDISQSGASQMVHQLEERLDTLLIDRSKRPFILTPGGERFFEGCRRLVQQYASLENEVRAIDGGANGKVKVATLYSIGLSHLAHRVKEFHASCPDCKVRLEYQHPEQVSEMVESGEADFGIISYPKSSRTLKAIVWREDPMVMVCAVDHPFAQRDAVDIAEIEGCPFVAFDYGLQIRQEIDRVLSNHNVGVHVTHEFDNIETLKRAIEISDGVSILPAPTVEREVKAGLLASASLGGVRISGGFNRSLGVIFRRGKPRTAAADKFLEYLLACTSAPAVKTASPAPGNAESPAAATADV